MGSEMCIRDSDAATSSVAGNKLKLAQRVGAKLLPGWIADLDGNPNEEPVSIKDIDAINILPLGGTREQGSHKGYGFGMMAEIMTSLLSGSLPPMLGGELSRHFFAAFNTDAFTDVEEFKDTIGVGIYHIDLHYSTGGDHAIHLECLPFQIPLGALIPVRMQNLLPAGKNIGVTLSLIHI